tara:strand:+ start:1118 stop:1669 length:552 start_codon:yes stop_codon:yes gene_type:complete
VDKNEEELYFIAIVPPSPLREEMQELKQYFGDLYNSKASLNSPPHITLHMPFRLKAKKEEVLSKTLREFAHGQIPFEIKLKDFGAFPPRVVFVDVKENEALIELQTELNKTCRQQLNLHNANYKDRGFHPHITLAFQDLRKPKFWEAWQEFEHKSFEGSFAADNLTLLKHDGKRWQEFREFDF